MRSVKPAVGSRVEESVVKATIPEPLNFERGRHSWVSTIVQSRCIRI